MGKNYYLSGEFNVTCDRCSKKIKAHQAKHEWTGFIVCGDCWEPRHPQDFVKARADKIVVDFQRPIQTPTYYICTFEQSIGIAGLGVAGCFTPGRLTPYGH